MFEVKRLKEERQTLIEALRGVDSDRQQRGEDATFNADEKEKFDQLRQDMQSLDERIETAKRLEAIPAVEERADVKHEHRGGYRAGLTRSQCDNAIAGFLTRGTEYQSAEMRASMESAGIAQNAETLSFRLLDEQPTRRALEVKTDTLGGYTVERYPINRIERALLEYSGGLRELATVVRTPKGGDYPIPTVVDPDTAEDHVEHAQIPFSDVTFDDSKIGCGTIDSKIIKVSLELLQDSALNMDQAVGQVLADRIATFVARRHILGVASPWDGLHKGAANSGVTFADNTPTFAELMALAHSVPPAYRASRSCAYVLNDATLLSLRLLTDSAGQPVWQSDLRSDAPDRLLGKPLVYAPEMPDGDVIYGDMSKFLIREVRNIVVRRLNELYLDSLAVGFVGYYRGGCAVVDVSGRAIVKASVATS